MRAGFMKASTFHNMSYANQRADRCRSLNSARRNSLHGSGDEEQVQARAIVSSFSRIESISGLAMLATPGIARTLSQS